MAKSAITEDLGPPMNNHHYRARRLITAITAAAAFSMTSGASAQYIWLDDKGVKQFSDMPPESSVPASRILRAPNLTAPDAPVTISNARSAARTEITIAEKDAEFRKRKLQQAEKEKIAMEERRQATQKAKECEHARAFQRTLESGRRIVRTDKNGERAYLTDDQRARELQDARNMLESCK